MMIGGSDENSNRNKKRDEPAQVIAEVLSVHYLPNDASCNFNQWRLNNF